ncbi:MAG: hypothetical protein AVDCRST_MAG40-811, partial [uncultured Gemmatimonadaceae bacterium]
TSVMRRVTRGHVNSASARARPAAPMRRADSGSRRTRNRRSARAGASFTSKRSPVSPSVTISGTAHTFDATQGSP